MISPTPKELNTNKTEYSIISDFVENTLFNSFGVGEHIYHSFLFMFNPFRIVRLKKDVGNKQGLQTLQEFSRQDYIDYLLRECFQTPNKDVGVF
jgi:hypothetical protein